MKKRLAVLAMACCLAMGTGCGLGANPEEETVPEGNDLGFEEVTVPKENYDSGVEVNPDAISFIYALGNAPATVDAANYFKMRLEQLSEGEMTCEIYADNTLGGERELLEGCQFGNYDIVLATNAPMASFLSDMYVLDAPWIFDSREQAYELLDGELGQRLGDGLEKKGFKTLQIQENSFRMLSTTDRKVETVEDLKGLKVRIMENEVQLKTWSLYGANPTPMSFTELFTALQQRTVDGQDNGAELTWQTKFCEVQQYFTTTRHVYSTYFILMSMKTFETLSPQHQDIVMQVSKEANDYERQRAIQYEEAALENIKNYPNTELIELTEEGRQSFIDASKPVLKLVREKMENPELLDDLLEAVGKTY